MVTGLKKTYRSQLLAQSGLLQKFSLQSAKSGIQNLSTRSIALFSYFPSIFSSRVLLFVILLMSPFPLIYAISTSTNQTHQVVANQQIKLLELQTNHGNALQQIEAVSYAKNPQLKPGGWTGTTNTTMDGIDLALAVTFLAALLMLIRMQFSNYSLSFSVKELTRAKLTLLDDNETLKEKILQRTNSLQEELAKYKLLNQELQFGKDRLNLLLSSTAEGILAVDLEGRCLIINDAGLQMLDYENKEQLLGEKVCAFLGCNNACDEGCRIITELSKNQLDSKEGVFFRRDNSSFPVRYWCHGFSHPYLDQGMVITFIDTTLRTKAEKELQREQDKYRRLVENLQEEYFFFIHNTEGVFTYVSPSVTHVLGYQPEDFLSHYESYLADSPLNKIAIENTERVLRGKKEASYDLEVFNKQGERRILEISETLVFDEVKQAISVEGIAHDVTVKRQVIIERTNRNKVLEQLASGLPLNLVLQTIASTTETSFPDLTCVILLVDQCGGQFRIGAAPSLQNHFMPGLDTVDPGRGLGLCGEAAVIGKRVIFNDFLTNPAWFPFSEIAAKKGITACWSEPILSAKDKVLGAFAILHKQTQNPTGQELEQLKNLANLASLAIEKNLVEQELNLAATTFQTHDAIIITDWNNNILRVNDAFCKITGYSADEVMGRPPNFLYSDLQDESFYKNMRQVLAETGRFEAELWYKRKDGTIFPERQMISAVKNSSGDISHFVTFFSDITEQKNAQSEIRRLAFYDPLTDLPNRRLLLDRIDKEVLVAKRHNTYGAVLFLDLDHFKMINDSLGHHIGDELLIKVGNRLTELLRDEDTAARIGGDEFVVFLPGNLTTQAQAVDHSLTVANKVLSVLSEPFTLLNQAHHITSSIGVTVFPMDDLSAEDILKQADTAMYRAKADGRNAVCFYQHAMQVAVEKRLHMEMDLRRALLRTDQLSLHYQAQVNSECELLSIEGLLRWSHPEKGDISPAEFIPIAEESSLILQVGEWVLKAACQQIKCWNENGFNIPHVAVNVSPKQFHHPDFVKRVQNKVAEYAVKPNQLLLEITEGVVIDRINDTIEKMESLNAFGVGISIDDFGTGYSSLSYLKKLPVKQLKIDRSFVLDVTENANDAAIVETIVAMAGHMCLDVIAEGVETQQQMDYLLDKGCKKFQGFYFSKAMEPADFEKKWFLTADKS